MALVLFDQTTQPVPTSTEEDDLLSRSSKKIKNVTPRNDKILQTDHWPKLGDKPTIYNVGGPSFVDKLKGTCRKGENPDENSDQEEDAISDDIMFERSLDASEMEYEEGKYKITENPMRIFPTFSFSNSMKKRLYKAWSKAVIVKLLGRSIGFRALEKRLQTMWAKRGVITLINIGHGYYIVKFTNKEDYFNALTGGPWMIYDHHLTVKLWEANFKPNKATIDKAVVWVRLSKVPLEYYDEEALTIIGSRIGKTIKVDMNTSCQLRGHFARVCVLVELGKQLMQGFYLDGEEFFLEYEGLHLLCTNCGNYGHRKELCPERKNEDMEYRRRLTGRIRTEK